AKERRITRWEHEHVIEAVQQRLDEDPRAMRRARRRTQAAGRVQRIFQRASRIAHRPRRRWRKTGENRPQIESSQTEKDFIAARRQNGGAEGGARLRTGAEAPRSRTGRALEIGVVPALPAVVRAGCESACDMTPNRLPTVTLVGHTINSS